MGPERGGDLAARGGLNNPSAGLASQALSRVIGKMDAAPKALARSALGFAGNPGLGGFLAGRIQGSWPVAVARQRVLDAIGGRSRTVRLSSETAAAHPRFAAFGREDWLRVQRVLDEGRVFLRKDRFAVGFLEEEGRLWEDGGKIDERGLM